MEVLLKAKNIEVSPTLRAYIEKKIGKLSKHLPALSEARVELVQEAAWAQNERFGVQVTIYRNGTLLRGEERGADLRSAVDLAYEVMARQVQRFRGRLYKRGRRVSLTKGALPVALGETEGTNPPEAVVKIKRFPIKPMFPEEAATQMELLGHDFFLFMNAETEQFNVIYRRRDGGYGLIEPEMA